MKTGWHWPLSGEDDEIAFTFAPSRGRAHIDKVLADFSATLLSDGAAACAVLESYPSHVRQSREW